MRALVGSCALVLAAGACTASVPLEPQPNPPEVRTPEAEPEAPAPTPLVEVDSACAAVRARLHEDMCGDEPECDAPELACEQALDLDGDSNEDRVSFAEVEGEVVLRVSFGEGDEQLLTEPFELTELPDLGQPWPQPSDESYPAELSWLAAWSVAKREADELVHHGRFPAGPALGDGLWLSGSDAAAMLVLSERGWLLVQLGY